MNYSLTRMEPGDGAGVSGGWTTTLARINDSGEVEIDEMTQYPKVGWLVLVESPSYWWRTSPVTEILEETENDESIQVLFKTGNSTYSFRRFK